MKKPNNKDKPQKLTAEDKFSHLMKTSELDDQELGKYLRSRGLHFSNLEEWKAEFLSSFKTTGRPKKIPKF